MNPAAYDTLLKTLQKLEKTIARAGVASVRASVPLQKRVAALHLVSETGGSLDDYTNLLAGRSAVQLLLRTVYARVLEDLGLLDPPRLGGERGYDAFRAVAPALGVRAYLKWVFRDLAEDFPALFTPLLEELPLPSEELCQDLWKIWHDKDGKGNLLYDWSGGDFESRFLGDLYQDLDADVRERYALLQTPDFVEEYILDQTLTPALKEFDPKRLRDKGETFRLIDPTCGSGHFLIGSFRRLAAYWEGQGCDPWEGSVRALESVWGCDINPYAVDIARFRLLLEVMGRTGVRDIEKLGKLVFNLRAMDSLIPWEGPRGQGAQGELFEAQGRLAKYATAEERDENKRFLKRAFHVVVGNPPYVTPKDPQKRDDYRVFWPASASGKYGLMAPFCERFFVLGTARAWIGQITGNAFIKREFGVSIIEEVLPRWDLTDIIDTSGAYIPGHGTPTVILIGRSQAPVDANIRCIGGKRGEPKAPGVPAEGKVWQAIAAAKREPNDESPFVTVSLYKRELFNKHPWNLNGGGAPELSHCLSTDLLTLAECASDFGYTFQTNCDPVFLGSRDYFRRAGLVAADWRLVCVGEAIRDYSISDLESVAFPYDSNGLRHSVVGGPIGRMLWPAKSYLFARRTFNGGTYRSDGRFWYEWHQFATAKHKTVLSIAFAFVSTHNHFVLDRGGKVFKQTAPIIKLPSAATVEDHLDLLGLLNSSALGFWMQQVFHAKGNIGYGGSRKPSQKEDAHAEEWEQYFEYDSTKLQKAPITTADREPRIALATALDATATERAACLPAAVLASADWTASDLPDRLAQARDRYHALTHRMVALQEELDWLTYGSYGLLAGHGTLAPDAIEPLAPGHRPFEILLARHNATCDPDERSAWFSRHGHAETITIPEHYTPATRDKITERLQIIATNKDVRLIEQPQFKRRWQLADFEAETKEATRDYLLDRLEDLFAPAEENRPAGPLATPEPHRLEAILSALAAGEIGERVRAVAKVHGGSTDVDLTALVESLLRDNALPDNPYRVYTAEGLRKLRKWQEVWALQDREDAGEKIPKIPEPPELGKDDFAQARFFQIRGKLNVPRERFILFADTSPPHFGWNGWRDRERALAQVEAFSLAEKHPTDPLPLPTVADPRRCGATLGLWESLPDVKRWGDPATKEGDHGELLALAQEACQKTSCPCEVVSEWQRWKEGKRGLGAMGENAPAAAPAATVEERAQLVAALDKIGEAGATVADLAKVWGGPEARLALVLDDLTASGDVSAKGRGKARRYRARPPLPPQQELFTLAVRGRKKKPDADS